ncbi:hypothetical protein [Granulicella paludicola]|uniref:hypothetical protein n=1 Tax=Granulicella paludicola TaxID=474951 RepID=UPI0021E0B683|nr:hypothetical protein [Granulicella paludicola]
MEISLTHLPQPVTFRFFADFDIQIQPKELSGFTKEQRTLLLAIIASPATLRRIARMAVETDLSDITGRQLSRVFEGASNEEILECVLPCLPDIEKTYWKSLRDRSGDTLHNEIVPIFLAFEVTFRRAGLEEISAESEPISKILGPTLDAQDLLRRYR